MNYFTNTRDNIYSKMTLCVSFLNVYMAMHGVQQHGITTLYENHKLFPKGNFEIHSF